MCISLDAYFDCDIIVKICFNCDLYGVVNWTDDNFAD